MLRQGIYPYRIRITDSRWFIYRKLSETCCHQTIIFGICIVILYNLSDLTSP